MSGMYIKIRPFSSDPIMLERSKVFPALLKYWRNRRGLSQLDLALTAEVSARHISFLETGRSQPSENMVLLLAATLDIPLRERNTMLREAGFSPAFEEPDMDALDPNIEHAIQVMLRQHDPFPMMIVNRSYDVLRMNKAAQCMVSMSVGAVPDRWNAIRAFFDQDWFRPFVMDWETTARTAISRLHREALQSPQDIRLRDLLDELLDAPDIPPNWKTHDLSRGSEGALQLKLQVNGQILSFVTTMMAFQAPQNITLEEVRIESYFPGNEATEKICHQLFGDAS